ncbi:heterokaryon incompatibility protein-domain-containing protein [Phaeosphaeria sp. MPI-PUGE-AT-0046c]|nr:heterokaryon incompatibility protein-domain-containing protein [Phaeosphaeria sp. MPI-PUGE-AT-0046c]
MDSDVFAYHPLRNEASIRVLLLEPDADYGAPLFASLQHIQIIKPPEDASMTSYQHPSAMSSSTSLLDTTQVEYEAISYAWGILPPTEKLGMSGSSPPTFLSISPVVDTMLRHLRYPYRQRCVWIDALCINQKDLEEKGGQVNFMGEIYRQAKAIVIWVGPPANLNDNMTNFFERLVRYATNPDDGRQSVERVATWDQLRAFLGRSWFTRRWTIQEAVLARQATILCGKHMINFMVFVRNVTMLAQQQSHIKSSLMGAVQKLGMMYRLRNAVASQARSDPLALFVDFATAECTNERDRIYALNALNNLRVPVTYTDSVENIFTEYAKLHVNIGNLAILNCAAAFRSPSSFLPTWVPDWQYLPIYTPLATQLMPSRNEGTTARCMHIVEIQAYGKNPALDIMGMNLGTVASCGEGAHFPVWGGDLLRLLQSWYNTFHIYAKRSAQHSSAEKQISSVVLGPDHPWLRDAYAEDTPGVSWTLAHLIREAREKNSEAAWASQAATMDVQALASRTPEGLKDILKHLTYRTPADPSLYGKPLAPTELVDVISRSTAGRTCFWTENGAFGLGPAGTKSGDIVVALPKSPFPYVLRPKATYPVEPPRSSRNWFKKLGKGKEDGIGTKEYTLIGDCYMHGFDRDQFTGPSSSFHLF